MSPVSVPGTGVPGLSVLGIGVSPALVDRWLAWFAPVRQPFRVDALDPGLLADLPEAPSFEVTDELRDTFFMYGGGSWVGLTAEEFAALPARTRAALTAERRHRVHPKPAPAWPTDPMVRAKLLRWVEAGTSPSQHALAREQLRAASDGPLPGAAELAGSFPPGSGPNCFGAVMAAAGEPVAIDWVQQDTFTRWVETHTDPSDGADNDHAAGQVLLWHEHGELAHAAVTVGDGWALHKPSQSWSSPTMVWAVEELVRSWRYPGTRLTRRVIRARRP